MLHNIQVNEQQKVLAKLAEFHYDFYLTGDRFFFGNDKNSYYDFFVELSNIVALKGKLHTILTECGFRGCELQDSPFIHKQVVGIYHHPIKINILMVCNATQTNNAQKVLKNSEWALEILRSQVGKDIQGIWNLALNFTQDDTE